jgi:hypothetical protein
MLKKKIWSNFQRIKELFTQKIVTKLSKIWVRDPRSGIRKNLSQIQGSKRHRIRNRNTAPGSGSGYGAADLIESGSNPNPDPKHSREPNKILTLAEMYIRTNTALNNSKPLILV